MKKLLSIILAGTMLLSLAACGEKKDTQTTTDDKTQTQTNDAELYAETIGFTIELENGGIMKGELYPKLAPKTVENFVKLAKDNFYDGLIFHRVIKDFMIQGGCFDKDMVPKEADVIVGEFSANGFNNPLKHTKGVLSMARTNDPNSASSQFFIMHQDSPHLDGQYAAFGKVTEGLEYIDEVAETKTTVYEQYGMADVPEEPIIIKTISIN